MTIDELDYEVARLTRLLGEAKRELHEAKVKATGVAVGDLVRCKGVEYRVAEVEPFGGGRPWLKGVRRKKDGEWSRRVFPLYSHWEMISQSKNGSPDSSSSP